MAGEADRHTETNKHTHTHRESNVAALFFLSIPLCSLCGFCFIFALPCARPKRKRIIKYSKNCDCCRCDCELAACVCVCVCAVCVLVVCIVPGGGIDGFIWRAWKPFGAPECGPRSRISRKLSARRGMRDLESCR